MDLGLKGRVAFVAASSRGLGRAIAEELAAEGCDLFMCSRSPEPLEEARGAIAAAHGVRVEARATDLSEPDDLDRAVAAALDAFPRIDILVTNTGGPPSGPFEAHTREAWSAAIRQNFDSVVNLARALLPGMKEAGWGRILNVTSIAVKQPVDNLILSNALRAGVTGFARTLANEVAPLGITVNNLLPGFTATDRLGELADHLSEMKGTSRETEWRVWEDQIPMGRIGRPSEFAALAAFLASERASYITGQSIAVDGGWVRSLL